MIRTTDVIRHSLWTYTFWIVLPVLTRSIVCFSGHHPLLIDVGVVQPDEQLIDTALLEDSNWSVYKVDPVWRTIKCTFNFKLYSIRFETWDWEHLQRSWRKAEDFSEFLHQRLVDTPQQNVSVSKGCKKKKKKRLWRWKLEYFQSLFLQKRINPNVCLQRLLLKKFIPAFFYSRSTKSAFLITTTKNHLTGSLETTGCQISQSFHYRRCQPLFIGVMSLF